MPKQDDLNLITALNLQPDVENAAITLKQQHPEIHFTSGRRNVRQQAEAMAANIIQSKNRKWIKAVYTKAPKTAAIVQKWVDTHPAAVTFKDIADGLELTINGLSPKQQSSLSKHLTGRAFDLHPIQGQQAQIKSAAEALPGSPAFLGMEGGLVRWHIQFPDPNPTGK